MNDKVLRTQTLLTPARGPVSKPADLHRRGQAHLDAGQHLEALGCYLELAKIDPNSWDVAFRCGLLLFELARHEEALSFLDRCQKLQPGHATTIYWRARTLRCLRRFEEAIEMSEQAEVLAPDDPDVFNNAGIILHNLCRDADAIDRFDRAIFLKPDFVDGIVNKANSLVQLRRFTEALSCYAAAKSLQPGDTSIDWNIANLKMLTGDFAAGWAGRESRWTKKQSAFAIQNFQPRCGWVRDRWRARRSWSTPRRDWGTPSSSSDICLCLRRKERALFSSRMRSFTRSCPACLALLFA
jgi:tetratricopeptide (TPR) repeat protein